MISLDFVLIFFFSLNLSEFFNTNWQFHTLNFNRMLVLDLANQAQAYEDQRCRCICPNQATVFNRSISNDRTVFTDYVPPNKCNCHGVILPKMSAEVNARAQEFCHRCECKYETRSTTIMMVVVIIVLWVLTLLAVYLVFFICLNPFNRRTHNIKAYIERDTEEAIDLLANEEADAEV